MEIIRIAGLSRLERIQFLIAASILTILFFAILMFGGGEIYADSLNKPSVSASAENGKIIVKCSKVTGAVKYKFYRSSKSAKKGFKLIASSSERKLTDSTASGLVYYKVCVIDEDGDKSSFSNVVVAYAKVRGVVSSSRAILSDDDLYNPARTVIKVKVTNRSGRAIYFLGAYKNYYTYYIKNKWKIKNYKNNKLIVSDYGWLSNSAGSWKVYYTKVPNNSTVIVYLSLVDARLILTGGDKSYSSYINKKTKYITTVSLTFSVVRPTNKDPWKTSLQFKLTSTTIKKGSSVTAS